jgi:hypothetical protein
VRWTKYGNRKTVIDGIVFDSKAEARRYCELSLMQKAGEISDLRLQVPFGLIETQRRSDGKMERGVVYVADFTYRDRNGQLVVEDVKGKRTAEYIIKRKLMLQVHHIEIREV